MSSTNNRRPIWVPVAAYLVLMPAMLWLGFWQLDKSERQAERNAAFEAAGAAVINAIVDVDPVAQRFERIRITGRFQGDRQVLIDNMVRGGRNGFFVITPFELDDGGTLLVNRGWIPQTPTREPIGNLAVEAGSRAITGRIGTLPVGGLKLGDGDPAGGAWPRVLQFPTITAIATQLEQPLTDWVLLLEPNARDGFERDWQPGGLPPERHLGYAVQWFAMAFALTVLAVIVAWKRPGAQQEP
ncbi:MAG: SURF1 family protein [Pseudomonadota bacterium]